MRNGFRGGYTTAVVGVQARSRVGSCVGVELSGVGGVPRNPLQRSGLLCRLRCGVVGGHRVGGVGVVVVVVVSARGTGNVILSGMQEVWWDG